MANSGRRPVYVASRIRCDMDARWAAFLSRGRNVPKGPVGFRFPLLLSGAAAVRDDEAGRFGIDVRVVNRHFGPL